MKYLISIALAGLTCMFLVSAANAQETIEEEAANIEKVLEAVKAKKAAEAAKIEEDNAEDDDE